MPLPKFSGRQHYAQSHQKRLLLCLIMAVLLLIVTLLDLLVGSSGMSIMDVVNAIAQGPSHDSLHGAIIWAIRLPMTLTALLVGGCLGLAGLLMQTVLANPLASPYTLGLSAAAGFGASLAILTGFSIAGFSWLGVPVLASAMALLAAIPIYLMGSRQGMTPQVLVLTGIVVLFFFQSLQSLMLFLAAPEVLQQIIFWLFGSLLKASWHGIAVTGSVLCLGLIIALQFSWPLTALSAGEEQAQGLGINVNALRKMAFLLATLLTAAAVSFVGTIGFIGLIAPHLARMLAGEDQRFLMILSMIIGALLLVSAAIIAKLVLPNGILPIGIVVALIGVPALFYLLLKGKGIR